LSQRTVARNQFDNVRRYTKKSSEIFLNVARMQDRLWFMRAIILSVAVVVGVGIVVACSSGTSSSSGSSGTVEPGCGNNQLDPGEECDQADNCYNNCTCINKASNCPGSAKTTNTSTSSGGTSGGSTSSSGSVTDGGGSSGGGDGGGSSSGGGDGGVCPPGKKVYVGKVGPQKSEWGQGGAVNGIPFGDNLCNTTFPGSHSCEFKEMVRAIGRSEIPTQANATLWVTRRTAVTYKGIMYPAEVGGGGSCDGWTYATNHRSNGQWYDMDPNTGDESRFKLDTTPFFDPNGANGTTEPGLPCGGANGGVGRFIPCCSDGSEACN
jgi:hypothetical protein